MDYKKDITLRTRPLEDLSGVEELYIDGLFLKSIILHSESGLLSLIKNDRCIFYSLLENDFLKSSQGRVTDFVVNVKFEGQDELQTRYVSKGTLLKYVHQNLCFANKEILRLFAPVNIKKDTRCPGLSYAL